MDCIHYAFRPLVKLFGIRRCRDFGLLSMKQYRDELIRANLTRKTINSSVGRVCRMFRWATENELLPPQDYQALAAVLAEAAPVNADSSLFDHPTATAPRNGNLDGFTPIPLKLILPETFPDGMTRY